MTFLLCRSPAANPKNSAPAPAATPLRFIRQTENFDQWVETIAWSPDSKFIYFTSEKEGASPIYRLNLPVVLAAGRPTQTGIRPIEEILGGTNDELSVSSDGKTLVFTQLSVRAPSEVYKIALEEQPSGATPKPAK